jgi:hypothetical protein
LKGKWGGAGRRRLATRVALPTSRELNKNTQLENVAMSSN